MPRRTRANPTAQAFGRALRLAREQRGETLEEVAGRVRRLDPKYLGELELGWHAPSIVTARRLAAALEVPLADLVRDL